MMRMEIKLIVEEKVIGAPPTFSLEVPEGLPLLTVIKMCQDGATQALNAFMTQLAMETAKANAQQSRIVGVDGRRLN